MSRKLLIAITVAGGLVLAPAVAGAASAETLSSTPALSSHQLAEEGFTVKPNDSSWGGTAELSSTSASAGDLVTLSGKAPSAAPAGQVLVLDRYVPTDMKSEGTFVPLGASTTVNKDGSYKLEFTVDKVGTYGYRLGYVPAGADEYVGTFFQFTTDKPGTIEPQVAVPLTSAQLSAIGYTKPINTTGWGGSAKASSYAVKVGKPIVLTGKAPRYVKPGSRMIINQYIATDTVGSGEMQAIHGVATKIRKDRTFKLVFTPFTGVHGYTAGVDGTDEWIGFNFQASAK